MEVQLSELIAKIKSEGLKTADEEAAAIIREATHKADEIRAAAHKESSRIIADAKQETERLEQSAREAIRQAGRNLILSLKDQIASLFNIVLQQSVEESLSPQVLEEAIVSLIQAWNPDSLPEVQVLLSPEDLQKVEKHLVSKLAAELKKGVEIKPFPEMSAGFRVSMKDGSAYYNFSDQGIAEIIGEYLNPRLTEILKPDQNG